MKRTFLTICLILTSILQLSVAQNRTQIALLKYGGGGDWYANPTSLTNLIAFCNADARMNLDPTYATVDVGSSEILWGRRW